MITAITVEYRGRPMLKRTVNAIMEAADPGTWGHDHPLEWSCPILAASAAESIRFTLGRGYTVTTHERTR